MNDLISRQAMINEINLHVGILYDSPTLVESLKLLVLSLPSAQPGWIPCKTKFPEKDGSYLVTAYNGQMAIYLFVKGMSENYWKQWGATAWCELPTPYREGGQE